MSQSTVNVSGIAPTTTETSLHDFFSFCGNIEKIDLQKADDGKQSATIHFTKHQAANTALMLNGGTLEGETLVVTSDAQHPEPSADEHHEGAPHIDQSDKPRAGIAAEYLARGYTLSDGILQRAIDIDSKQGISKRFLNYFNQFDTTAGEKALGPNQTISGKVQQTFQQAHSRAKSIDEQKGYSKVAHDYYSKAIASPWGKSVLSFYTNTSKQVTDIHSEARRIADQHKPRTAPAGSSATAPAAATPAAGSEAQPEPTTQAAPTVV
ncbi:hypothetical protein CONPUDRAFT_82266 [Coniophora puteana RWD-64-598 SS2]|uniref:RRM domain-containing protein n=1 Tax=Coniophora puteana (strain RWD-64-598) TaxID=741705 RepID=A0A5M3MQ21_CONPW|nr:uncharacterized protein CONPUDRAFT_82266 [Coniophora puteana RWD-64-598 SS2]EIW81243.1 hypothetical protein CONPUDRAFT_82266 [Coniophora puteana RWD-64-598 SS2]